MAEPQALSAKINVATPVTLAGTIATGDTLTYLVTVQPTKGSVSCSSAGACSYRSVKGASGTYSFTFRVSDGFGEQYVTNQ